MTTGDALRQTGGQIVMSNGHDHASRHECPRGSKAHGLAAVT